MREALRQAAIAFAGMLAVGTVVGIVAFFAVEAAWRKILHRSLRKTARG
jgi:hypothetical protein